MKPVLPLRQELQDRMPDSDDYACVQWGVEDASIQDVYHVVLHLCCKAVAKESKVEPGRTVDSRAGQKGT